MLDDNAFLKDRSMLAIMLVTIVGMYCMRHVSADQEAILDGALHGPFLPLGQSCCSPGDGVLHHWTTSTYDWANEFSHWVELFHSLVHVQIRFSTILTR